MDDSPHATGTGPRGRLDAVRSSPVVVPLQLVFAVNGALYGTLLPRFPEMADRLGATEGEFGFALLGAGVGGTISSAAVTWVARRVGGPARAVAVTAPLLAVAVAAAGAAPTVPLLFAAITLAGLADGICDPSMNAVGAAEQQRIDAVFMGRLHATWSGATLAATGVGALVAALGVPVVPHVLVACALLLPVHVLSSRRLVAVGGHLGAAAVARDSSGSPDPAAAGHTPHGPASAHPDGTGGPDARRARLWVATVVVSLAAIIIEIPPQEWAGLLLRRELGTSPGLAGAAPFAFLGGVFVARLALDRMVERHGWRRVVVASATASLIGMGLGLAVGATTGSPWPVLAGLTLAGCGAAPHFPVLFDRAEQVARRLGVAPDAGAGIIATVTRAAMLIGPLAVGQIADRAGLFVGLAIVPALAALMIPGLLVVVPRDPQRVPAPAPAQT